MARLNLRSLSAVDMVAADFTEEVDSTAEEVFTAVEDFTEAGSGAEDFMAGEDSAAERFTVEVDFTAELSVAGVGFEAEPAFEEERSAAVFVEASVAAASGAVSVSEGAALDGEDGAGVGA